MKANKVLNIILVLLVFALILDKINQGDCKDQVLSESGVVAKFLDENEPAALSGKKISLGTPTALLPKPIAVIGSYSKAGEANIMTAAWIGICNSRPPKIAVSMREATQSYHNITHNQAFTVSIPSTDFMTHTDYVGIVSGRDHDKFEELQLTPILSDSVYAPYIQEFPVVIECRVTEMHDLGSHRQFIGEIIDVKADVAVLGTKGKIDLKKVAPFVFDDRGYYGIGPYISKAFTTRSLDKVK